MKLTLEERLRYVKLHLDKGLSFKEIYQKYGFEISRQKYFCQLYLLYGEKAFKNSDTKRKGYSRELKLKTIKRVLGNKISIRKVSLELMLTDSKIVSDWIQKYKKEGEAGIKDTYSREAYKHHDDKIFEKEYKKLLKDLEETKAENEYLKKSFPQVLKRSKQLNKK